MCEYLLEQMRLRAVPLTDIDGVDYVLQEKIMKKVDF